MNGTMETDAIVFLLNIVEGVLVVLVACLGTAALLGMSKLLTELYRIGRNKWI